LDLEYIRFLIAIFQVKQVLVATAWRVFRLRMEKMPPDVEGSCEYIE
jgi:hypothetical protein